MARKPREARTARVSTDGAGKCCLGHAAKLRFGCKCRTAGGTFQAEHHPRRFRRRAKRTGQHAARWFRNLQQSK